MIRINLAPPGERPRGDRPWPLMVGIAAMVVAMGLGWWYAALIRGEAHVTEEIAALTRELTALQAMRGRGENARETVADLVRRTQAIRALTRDQGLALRVLDSVLDALPHEVWLTALEGRGRELRAAGSAPSASAVADFTSNLRASGAFKDVDIAVSRRELGKARPGPVSFEVTGRFAP